MFSLSVVDTDWFLDLPLSTQALYFHLNMRADDDGFVDAPNSIVRKVGASKNDFDLLLAKRFVLQFESGIIVIKHWRMHNTIQKDRYVPTQFQEEFKQLSLKQNKSYTDGKKGNVSKVYPECIQNDSTDKDIDIDKEEEKDKEYKLSNDNILSQILRYWNEKSKQYRTDKFKMPSHKAITPGMEKAMNKALSLYGFNNITLAIERYAQIGNDDSYFFNYVWSLEDFLKQGNALPDFLDEGNKWINYINSKSGVKKQEQEILSNISDEEFWKKWHGEKK